MQLRIRLALVAILYLASTFVTIAVPHVLVLGAWTKPDKHELFDISSANPRKVTDFGPKVLFGLDAETIVIIDDTYRNNAQLWLLDRKTFKTLDHFDLPKVSPTRMHNHVEEILFVHSDNSTVYIPTFDYSSSDKGFGVVEVNWKTKTVRANPKPYEDLEPKKWFRQSRMEFSPTPTGFVFALKGQAHQKIALFDITSQKSRPLPLLNTNMFDPNYGMFAGDQFVFLPNVGTIMFHETNQLMRLTDESLHLTTEDPPIKISPISTPIIPALIDNKPLLIWGRATTNQTVYNSSSELIIYDWNKKTERSRINFGGPRDHFRIDPSFSRIYFYNTKTKSIEYLDLKTQSTHSFYDISDIPMTSNLLGGGGRILAAD